MIGTLVLASLLAPGQQSALDKPIETLSAVTVAGKKAVVPDPKAKATVLVFLLTDCPIANRYAPEMKRIEGDYEKKGVVFYRVYVYKDASLDSIREHTRLYTFKSPAIHDADHRIVKAVGARVTPEAVVLTPDGVIEYRGRIDDMYIEHGRIRETEYRHDLREALDELLAGKRVSVARTTALGCFIEG